MGSRQLPAPLLGLAAGALGSLPATWAMIQAQNFLTAVLRTSEPIENEPTGTEVPTKDPPPVRMAAKISTLVLRHTLTDDEKGWASTLVQYGFGAILGGVYGSLCEVAPGAGMRHGLGFGAALWLLGDELSAPLLGIADLPAQTPLAEQGVDLAGHLVYGWGVESVRRVLRGTRVP